MRRDDTFESLNIPTNAVLTFHEHDDITCNVLTGKLVLFMGRIMSIGKATKIILELKRNKQSDVSGFLYWCYNGQRLVENPGTRNKEGE